MEGMRGITHNAVQSNSGLSIAQLLPMYCSCRVLIATAKKTPFSIDMLKLDTIRLAIHTTPYNEATTSHIVADQVYALPGDILVIANTPTTFPIEEENVIVYLAGYVGKKSLRRFACRNKEHMCMRSSVHVPDKPENGFVLLQNKQSHYLAKGGLVPCESLVNLVSLLEMIFSHNIAPAVHSTKVRVNLYFYRKHTSQWILCTYMCHNEQ